MSNFLWPHGLQHTRLLCPWDFPGKNTGVGCHFLLQGFFPTWRLNPHLLYWQADSLHWATREALNYICVCVCVYIHKYIKMCIYSIYIHKYIYKFSRNDKNTVCVKIFLTLLLSVISLQRSWEKGVVRCHPWAFLCPASGCFHDCCSPPQDPLRRHQNRYTLFPGPGQLHTLDPNLEDGNYCSDD